MVINLFKKWTDNTKKFLLGTDNNGNLFCKHIHCGTTMVCENMKFRNRKKVYTFICPKCGTKKTIQ